MRRFLTLHDPAQAAGFYEAGLWTRDTFYSLLADNAAARPDQPALRDGRRTLDWASLRQHVDAMADDLTAQGLIAGDRVSLWLSNRAEAIIAFLACAREGIACNPSLHRTYTCAEIVSLLKTLNSAALVTEPDWGTDRDRQNLDAMLEDLPFLRKVYTPGTFPPAGAASARPYHLNPDSVAYLAFTSGTTGAPKCVMHSSNTLLANGRDLVRDWRLGHGAVARDAGGRRLDRHLRSS